MPRMNTCAAELLPVSVPYEWNWMLGATLSRSVVLITCWRSSEAALSAVMATGVSCRLSDRRRAVTMISSIVSADESAELLDCGGDCAVATDQGTNRHRNEIGATQARFKLSNISMTPPGTEYLYATHTICVASEMASAIDSRP